MHDTGRGTLDVPDSRRKIRDAGQWTWDSERVGQWTRKTVDVDKAVRFRDSPWAKNGNQAQMTHEMCKTADVDKTLPRSAASGSRLVYAYLYLDKGSQGLGIGLGRFGDLGALNFTAIYYTSATWGTWDPSTLLLFAILWPLGPSGSLQLYCYLLYFSHLGCQAGPEVIQRGP